MIKMINQKLEKLYRDNQSGIDELGVQNSNLESVHLLHVWEKEYLDSDYRILFLGKETNGWMGDYVNEVTRLTGRYERFELCKKKKGNKRTVIWQAMYEMNKLLNPEKVKNFVWSNVSKSSTMNGKGLSDSVFERVVDKFNVLEEEIRILNPDVVIFLSGHGYDSRIRKQLQGDTEFFELDTNIDKKELAIVKNKSLPVLSFRTHHPGYLRPKTKWDFLYKIVRKIKESEKS